MAQILVIDDDEPTRATLRAMLEPTGYRVVEAADGEAGVKLFRQESIDLVILDILMPHQEGIETIRELKADFPDVKIIAMSGSGIRYLHMAEEFGALRAFLKPLYREEVLETVRELLAQD